MPLAGPCSPDVPAHVGIILDTEKGWVSSSRSQPRSRATSWIRENRHDSSLWFTNFTVHVEFSVKLYFSHSSFYCIFHAAAKRKIK